MAKDPAFLFYSNDFLSGTFTMTNEQVGKYIRLLCLQHQKGALTEKDMLNICGSYDEDVFSKFKKRKGLFWNERLSFEAEKRKLYSISRKQNRSKKEKDGDNAKTYVKHMENENENENENRDDNYNKAEKNFKNIPPSIDEIIERCKELGYPDIEIEGNKFFNYYQSNGWKVGKNKMKNWSSALTNWFTRYCENKNITLDKIKLQSNLITLPD